MTHLITNNVFDRLQGPSLLFLPDMLPILTLLMAMLSIQSGASLAKQIFPVLGAPGTTTLRIVLAALILSLIWRPWRRKLTGSEKQNVLIYGTSLGVMNLFFYMALAKIPLGIAVALEFTGPLAIAVFSSRRKIDFIWALLAALGLALILPISEISEPLNPIGIFYALMAGACWAFYILFGQRISRTLHGGYAAAFVIAPVGIFTAGTKLLDQTILLQALGLAVLSSALPYSLEMIALKALPTRTFGVLMSLEPALAALSGFVFLNEKLEPVQWFAIFCVMMASIGSTFSSRSVSPSYG